MLRSPHCPACAAALPEIDAQEIVTCDCCGTDVNAAATIEEQPPPRSPPLSGKLDYHDQRAEGPAGWNAAPFVHQVLTADNPEEGLRRAKIENRRLVGEDGMTWAPALLLATDEAERAGHEDLALELAMWIYTICGGSRDRPYRYQSSSGGSGPHRDTDRPVYGHEIAWERDTDPRMNRMVLQHVAARRNEFPASDVTLVLLGGTGIAALRTLVLLGTAAEARGDDEYLAVVTESIRRLTFDTADDRLSEILLDMHTWLIPTTTGAVRARLIDDVADLVDLQFDEPGEEYDQDWRGPADILTAILLWLEDVIHEDEPLAEEVFARIAALHRSGYYHRSRDLERWVGAIRALGTPEARAAAVRTFYEVFGPPPEKDIGDPDPTPNLEGKLPPLAVDAASGIRFAKERDGQAPCPSCGHPLALRASRLLAECDHCGELSRLARAARQVRRVLHEGLKARMLEWSPERLVRELTETEDESLRRGILDELAAATTDGARYIELAPALVRYMLSDVPEDVERRLGDGIRGMLRHEDPEFRAALFAAVRDQAFTTEGSDRLLDALEHAGPSAVGLLLDLHDHATQEAEDFVLYADRAQQVAFNILDEDMRDPGTRLEQTEWLLTRLVGAGPTLAETLPSFLGHRLFDVEESMDPSQETVLRHIDDYTNPERVQYHAGLLHGHPRLYSVDYSATAEEIDNAAKSAGYGSWAEACEKGGYAIEKLIHQIPATGVGGPTLRQIGTLASQIGSFWKGPTSGEDLVARVELLEHLRNTAPRLLVLNSIQERPSDLTPEARAEAEALLVRYEGDEHLAPTIAHVRVVLARDPAPPEKEEATAPARGRRNPGRPWWKFWG